MFDLIKERSLGRTVLEPEQNVEIGAGPEAETSTFADDMADVVTVWFRHDMDLEEGKHVFLILKLEIEYG